MSKIRELRRRKAWRQHDLAEESGVGLSTIKHLETHPEAEPRMRTLAKLAQALGVEPQRLMEDMPW